MRKVSIGSISHTFYNFSDFFTVIQYFLARSLQLVLHFTLSLVVEGSVSFNRFLDLFNSLFMFPFLLSKLAYFLVYHFGLCVYFMVYSLEPL